MIAYPFLIVPDVRAVVGYPDMEEDAGAWLRLGVEVSLIPEHTLVVEKLGHLGIPIARDFDGECGSEVVFLVVLANNVGMLVQGVGPVIYLAIFRCTRRVPGPGRRDSASLRLDW